MKLSNTMMINASLLPSSKKAFTLAEVLITLSILGVVAALTIPSLVNRQSDLAAQVKLKKAIANYENMAAVYMVENEATDLSGLLTVDSKTTGSGDDATTTKTADCDTLTSYFKVVNGPDKDTAAGGCSFTTSDGAAWYIDGNTGYATVADSATSPRYAVSMWTVNGQVNGTGKTDGTSNAPETPLATLNKSITSGALTPTDRKIAPVTEFMKGTYYCSGDMSVSNDDVTCAAS